MRERNKMSRFYGVAEYIFNHNGTPPPFPITVNIKTHWNVRTVDVSQHWGRGVRACVRYLRAPFGVVAAMTSTFYCN